MLVIFPNSMHLSLKWRFFKLILIALLRAIQVGPKSPKNVADQPMFRNCQPRWITLRLTFTLPYGFGIFRHSGLWYLVLSSSWYYGFAKINQDQDMEYRVFGMGPVRVQSRFLKQFSEGAQTTSEGRPFQSFTTRAAKDDRLTLETAGGFRILNGCPRVPNSFDSNEE